MKERPIIFSGPMVLAILAGTKTQTRRILNARGVPADELWAEQEARKLPRYEIGDELWVRETWARVGTCDPGFLVYRATYPNDLPANVENVPPADAVTWRPSIHMPRAASRITLRVTSVRVERLQEITEDDARAEGIEAIESREHENREPGFFDAALCDRCGGRRLYDDPSSGAMRLDVDCSSCDTHAKRFRHLWDSINANRAPWSSNPWVWVIGFEVAGGR